MNAVVRAASMPCARLIERNGCLFDRPWRGRSPSSGVWCYTTFLLRGTHERPPRSSTFCASTTLVTIRPPFLLNLYRTGESGRQRELLDWSGNGGAVECQGRHSFVAIPLNQTLCTNVIVLACVAIRQVNSGAWSPTGTTCGLTRTSGLQYSGATAAATQRSGIVFRSCIVAPRMAQAEFTPSVCNTPN